MADHESVKHNSDSLIELLTAQCADLERLLALAREETEAAREGRFFRIFDIVGERNKIATKLETFQQQISELRGALDGVSESVARRTAVDRVVELANLTLAQDSETRRLLTTARAESADAIRGLERNAYGANAYQREEQKGLAVSRDV